jgi:hypothetical protein
MVVPPFTIWESLGWAGLIVLVAVVGLAVRAYRLTRTRSFALLLAACISLVIARGGRIIISFISGIIFGHASRERRMAIFHFSDRVGVTFELLEFLLLAAALFSFIREYRADTTRTI